MRVGPGWQGGCTWWRQLAGRRRTARTARRPWTPRAPARRTTRCILWGGADRSLLGVALWGDR